jgi:hypothetical protein
MYKEMRYLHVENVALTQFKGGRGSIQKKEEEENVCSKKGGRRKCVLMDVSVQGGPVNLD